MPVTTPDLDKKPRFQATEMLRAHGIKNMVDVFIPGADRSFSVLDVDSTKHCRLTEADMSFLQGYMPRCNKIISPTKLQRQANPSLVADFLPCPARQLGQICSSKHNVLNHNTSQEEYNSSSSKCGQEYEWP
jgi:hypothetical protein